MHPIPTHGLPQDPAEQPPKKTPDNKPKRKRSFVPLACSACRKRKTKCDGRRPNCFPCQLRNLECTYDFPDDVPAAQRGKRNNERLLQTNVDLKSIFETLRHGDESNALALLRDIRSSESLERSLETILESVTLQPRPQGDGQETSKPQIQPSALRSEHSTSSFSNESQFSTASRSRTSTAESRDRPITGVQSVQQDRNISEVHGKVEVLPLSEWTSVPGTDEQFSKLLTLLWTWDTAFVGVIYRDSFEEDLRNGAHDTVKNSPGRHFCSTFLVNALLAFATTYTTEESGFVLVNDSFSRGQLFIDQAEQEIETRKSNPAFDFLQGLILLFAYESRVGHASKAKVHLELMFKVYSLLDFTLDDVAREIKESDLEDYKVVQAKSKILWGLYVFEWRLSYTYGVRKRLAQPTIPKSWNPDKADVVQPHTAEYWWFPYPQSFSRRKSYLKELFNAECCLIEIAESILEFAYPQGADRPITSTPSHTQAVSLIKSLTEWKLWFMSTIPEEALDLPLALHISYSYEMLTVLVLRKVSHITRSRFGSNSDSPQALCHMHTNAIASILWNYRALYTIQYEFWAIQACALVAFSTVFNLDENTTLLDSFDKVCTILFEISKLYPVATDFLYAIRKLVEENDVRVSRIAKTYLDAVKGPSQRGLSEMWRTPVVLARDDGEGLKGGIRDVTLGDLM